MPGLSPEESDRLESIYYNAGDPAGFGGVAKLVAASRLNRDKVVEWLRSRRTYTTHKPARRRYPTRQYVTRGIDTQWQADLVEMIPYAAENNGNRYLLTVIDIFSRYAWARPLQRKTPSEVVAAFRSIFEQEGRKPRFLQTDQGLEFENHQVRSFLEEQGIEQFSIKSQFKAALVERFNRTLKTKMWRIFTHRGSYRWTDILPKLVEAYNQSIHRSVGQAPAKVNKQNEVDIWLHQYAGVKKPSHQRKTKFNVGDQVRISKAKGLFEKGYKPNWSEEIFTVHAVNRKYTPIQYQLSDHSGEVIEGSFYEHELQAVDAQDQVYTIERILRTRGKGARKQYLVKWLGYQETSWISQSDFKKLT